MVKVFELEDSTDNLCTYCGNCFPSCAANQKFGNGIGDDNVIGCNNFDGDTSDTFINEVEITEEEFVANYV
jgi:hypothetical protein